MKKKTDELLMWLANGERGVSSNTMVEHITGIECTGCFGHFHPLDPSDFGRCRKLCERVQMIGKNIEKMKTCSKYWSALVEHWESLCTMMDEEAPEWRDGKGCAYRTYREMDRIFNLDNTEAQAR